MSKPVEPLTAPSPGHELCYQCGGMRICIFCHGTGALVDGRRCSECWGDSWCVACGGAGELPAGTAQRLE